MNIITTCRCQPRKREIGRAENPAPTEKYLGDPSKAVGADGKLTHPAD